MLYWLRGRSRTLRVLERELRGEATQVGWPRAVIGLIRLVLAI